MTTANSGLNSGSNETPWEDFNNLSLEKQWIIMYKKAQRNWYEKLFIVRGVLCWLRVCEDKNSGCQSYRQSVRAAFLFSQMNMSQEQTWSLLTPLFYFYDIIYTWFNSSACSKRIRFPRKNHPVWPHQWCNPLHSCFWDVSNRFFITIRIFISAWFARKNH